MAVETVKIYTVDEADQALVGVLVRFYDVTGTTLQAQVVSALVGSDAIAETTLSGAAAPTPTEYMIRLSKIGVGFDGSLGDDSKTPQLIEVYSPPAGAPTGKNDFTVQGQTFTRPAALDPRLCRASGFIHDLRGLPLQHATITINPYADPIIVDGFLVSNRPVHLKSNADGYYVVDLYRTATLTFVVEGMEHEPRVVEVPDAPSVNLPDLLFPVVASIVFTPTSISLAPGGSQAVTAVVKSSVGVKLTGVAHEDVTYESSDPDVVSVSVQSDQIVVTGIAAGSATVTAVRTDTTISSIPSPSIVYTPLPITVT